MTGIIRWEGADPDYGLIYPDDGGDPAWLSIEEAERLGVSSGQRVEYEVNADDSPKGSTATLIQVLVEEEG